MVDEILKEISGINGHTGFYYKNLVTGETAAYHEKDEFFAASIIKLPLFMSALLLESKGEISLKDKIVIRDDQKVPGCGAVKEMTGDVEIDLASLCRLMVVISDNTATNAVFRYIGRDTVKKCFNELGFYGTMMNRELYDYETEAKGINNFIVPEELGKALERLYKGEIISPEASEKVIEVLKRQQVEHKLRGRITDDVAIAHKTGEEDGTTHDVGIIYGSRPFVVCFASNEVYVPEFEDFIRRTAAKLYEENR